MPQYYRVVEIGEDGRTTEPVAYVGVHPIRWHKHPDEPQVGFEPTDIVDVLLEACELAREQLEYVVNGWPEFQDTRISWALGKVSDAIAKAKGEG